MPHMMSQVRPEKERDLDDASTIENRLYDIAYQTAELRTTVSHIFGVLFGIEPDEKEPMEDSIPSIVSTISDVERNVRKAREILDTIEVGLTSNRRA